ncbi:MAG: Uma2 family endonuclease [Vulcanimicrobiaceae bacterium]
MAVLLDDRPETEYLDGRPYPKVSPKRVHARVQFALAAAIDRRARRRGLVGTEWRFRLGSVDGTNTSFVPDVAYVSYDRLRPLSDEEADEPPFAPDIAAEVRSPSQRLDLLARKIARYLATGATIVLDVDPMKRTIVAHAFGETRTYEAGARFAHPALPWLDFEVAELFADIEIPR